MPVERRVDDITSLEELSTGTNEKDSKDRALWVGLRPSNADILSSTKPAPVDATNPDVQAPYQRIEKIKIKGNSSIYTLLVLPELPIWPLVENMSKVVVRFNVQHSDRLTFYELVNQDPKTKVFFLLDASQKI